MKKILLAIAAIPAVFWFIWMAFSASAIQSMIEDAVAEKGVKIEVDGLKKGFFYTLSIDKVALKGAAEELLSINNIGGRINPFSLIALRLDTTVDGEIGSGKFSGRATFAKNRLRARLECKGVDIREVPFLQHFGIRGSGTISGRFTATDDSGRVEFVTRNASFEPAELTGIKVPMDIFTDITGSLVLKGNRVDFVSVSLGGKDIYGRLKGTITNGIADLTMELMPAVSFLENPLFQMGLDRYKVSPGYYVIPIRGRLSL